MRKLYTLISFFAVGFFIQLNAQTTGVVQGQVQTQDDKPFDGAILVLAKARNGAFVKSEITAEDGNFKFEGLANDTFVLTIENMGYEPYTSQLLIISQQQILVELPPITLQEKQVQLSTATVTAKIPFIERKIDRTVVNVDGLISNAGLNAFEILEKGPGVMVNQSDNITLRGKSGVAIFIDDKPSYLSGADLANYLKSLPASTIKQIEIMTNPPAKYDAAGGAGVINIITKKNRVRGYNGNVSLSYGQGVKPRTNNSVSLNFRNNKFNIFSMLNYTYNAGFEDLNINRFYKNPDLTTKSDFFQNTYSNRFNHSCMGKVGIDYYATEKTTIGMSLNGLANMRYDHRTNHSRSVDAAGGLLGRVEADNNDNIQFLNGGANLNLRQTLDTLGKKLTVDLDYVKYATLSDQAFLNKVFLGDGLLDTTELLVGDLPTGIDIYALKSDYSMPFWKDGSFEAGVKVSYTQTDNKAKYNDVVGAIITPNYDRSNHFKYNEMINAGYINFSKSIKRLQLQAGLRVENTISMANQLGNIVRPGSSYDTTYTEFFPTAYAAYTLDSAGRHQLGFSYGRRINRPYFQDLNPFLNPLDKFTIYSGNPYLKPTFSNTIDFSYTFNNLFTFTLSYNESLREISETVKIVDGIFYSQPANLGKSEYVSLNVNSNFPVTKWWNTSLYSEVTYFTFQSDLFAERLNSKGTFWYIQSNNSFQLGKGWSAELSGTFNTDIVYAQFLVGGFGVVNMGVQKKLLNNKLVLKLAINDLFYTRVNRGTINNLSFSEGNYKGLHDTRVATLTVAYNFGKQYENRGRHNVLGSDEERKRVKG